MPVFCAYCEKVFSSQSNINRHIREVHKETKGPDLTVEYSFENNIFKCLDGCEKSFKLNKDLRNHLQSKHDFQFTCEILTFANMENFQQWMEKTEIDNNVKYFKPRGVKRAQDNTETIFFNCSRSGKQKILSEEIRKRSQKTQGSVKLGFGCTSQIILHRNSSGECRVKYFKEHYGHNPNLKHLNLSKTTRKDIVSKLIMGVSPQQIDGNMERNFDDMLFNMLKECKTLPVFLDNIFGFLKRRTDFYHVTKEENSPVGLPPGLAEQFVKHAFFKWKPDENTNVRPANEVPEPTQEVTIQSTPEHIESTTAKPTQCQPEEEKNTQSTTDDNNQSKFSSSECYNGAVYENYSWSQNISDIDITVRVPSDVVTKDLDLQIQTKKISVKLKSGVALLEGELCQKCKPNDVIWSLDKGKLEIHLDKCLEMWWDRLLTSEPKLDVQKMDCSRPFEELSEEAQAKIEELQWNQERKRLGLLTSNQEMLQDKLRQAWNAEGSPFSGPFDPNAVVIQ